MKDELAVLIWRRRMSARLKMIREVLKLVVDFWTALYIVVPSLILIVSIYRELLSGLPAWVTPEWEMFLVLGLAFFMARGNLRSYLEETDLTFLYPSSNDFHHLFRFGMQSSLAINNIVILLLIVGLFPFYLHLEAVSIHIWLGIGLWIIVIRSAFLIMLFFLQERASRLAFRLLFLMGFIAIWNRFLMPFIHTGETLYLTLMLGIALFMLVCAMLVKLFLPINNWDKVVKDEANYNIRTMGQLLGYAGKPERKRNGASIWSQKRLGIPFRKIYSLPYFYMKYFLRQKAIWQIFMEICVICLLVTVAPISNWAILGFIAVADLMWGLLIRSVVAENKGKLDQFTQGLDINDNQKGLRNLYIIMMAPLGAFPMFSGLAGTMNLIQVLGGIIILLGWVLISSLLMINISSIKQLIRK